MRHNSLNKSHERIDIFIRANLYSKSVCTLPTQTPCPFHKLSILSFLERLSSGQTECTIKCFELQVVNTLNMFKDTFSASSEEIENRKSDYFVWGYLEAHTNRRPHTTKASLIASIKESFASMPSDLLSKA